MNILFPFTRKGFFVFSLCMAFAFIPPVVHGQKTKPTVTNSQKPVAKSNVPANISRKYTIIDSIYHDEWEMVGEPLGSFPLKNMFVDSMGNFTGVWLHRRYDFNATPLKWEDSLVVSKLVNNKWVDWHRGLPPQTDRTVQFEMSTDKRYQLFMSCNKGLYKLSENGWTQIFTGCCQNIPKIMSDGNLYTIKTVTEPATGGDSSISVSLCHFSQGTLGKCVTYTTTKPLNKTKDVTFDVAKDGSYYCYVTGEDREPSAIHKWNGSEWVIIGIMPAKISGLSFADNNDMYAHTFKPYYDTGEEEDNYLKKWDGKNWTDISLPRTYKNTRIDSFEKKNIRYELMVDEKGVPYLSIWCGANWTSFLYKSVNNKWVEWANNRDHDFFPTSKEVYSYPRFIEKFQVALYKPKRYWEIRKREYSDIPVQPGLVLPATYAGLLSGYRLLLDEKKKCIREKTDRYSTSCMMDQFDSIAVVKTPIKCLLYVDPDARETSYAHIEMKDYALQLISGQDTLYTNLTKEGILYRQGFVKKYIPADPGEHCSHCDGAGFTGGGTVSSSQKVGKDWVPATRETRRVLTTNGYRYETVTSPGYYRSYEYKTDSKTVSGSQCKKCKGVGAIGKAPAKWVLVNYSKNNFTGRYSQLWHMAPN
jgi:hypothetical protein